jgi:ABC-type nitrate/sulfonate/bicarbonate transport system substrate-binding protein
VTHVPEILPSLDSAYAAQGIQVHFISSTASPIPLLVSGQADLIFFGMSSLFLAKQSGAPPIKLIYHMGNLVSTLYVAAAPGVTSLSQCKRMGTLSVNATSYNWAQYFKQKFHYTYDLVPIASSPAQGAAQASGNTDCSWGTYGLFSALVANGTAHWLMNPEMPSTIPKGTPLNLLGGGLEGTDSWLKATAAWSCG